MAYGYRDTKSLVNLTGVDASEMRLFQLEDGTTFEEVASRVNLVLTGLNAEIAGDPLWSSLVSYTDQPDVSYNVGNTAGFARYTEYGQPDPQRGEIEGHMLPLVPYDRGMGWTWYYLKNAQMRHIDADLLNMARDLKDLWRQKILGRLFQRGDDSGKANGLGTGGYSPGFATAAASTAVDFIPPKYNGVTFTSDHEHYVGISGGAFTAAVFADAKDELTEHGHNPTFNAIIGKADEDTVKGLTGFTPIAESLVAYGNDTSLAALGTTADVAMNGSYIIGTIEDFVVRVVPSIPQYYGFCWKSYGPNSVMNPLRIRLEKGMSTPQFIMKPDERGANPLFNLMVFGEFGVGVSDRTGGSARYVNSATWADATIA